MSIRLEHVSYAYEDNSSKKNYALKDVNLEIKKEEFIDRTHRFWKINIDPASKWIDQTNVWNNIFR